MASHIIVPIICIIGFAEAILMALVDWEDLAISVRRSPRKLYNVLRDEFGLPEWNELSVVERRSMKRRYNILIDFMGSLPPWEDLPVIDRRSHKRIYKVIKSTYDGDYDNGPVVESPPTAAIPEREIPREQAEP